MFTTKKYNGKQAHTTQLLPSLFDSFVSGPLVNLTSVKMEDVGTVPQKTTSSAGENDTKPKWMNKEGKVSKKEARLRRNVRLSKMLQPKSAVVVLNELSMGCQYTVTTVSENPTSFLATVCVDDVQHLGYGGSKMVAKNAAAENALKYLCKFGSTSTMQTKTVVNTTKDRASIDMTDTVGTAGLMECEDATSSVPWQQIASFAMYKLMASWGEDPDQFELKKETSGPDIAAGATVTSDTSNFVMRPAKQLPAKASEMNPVALMNEMAPHARFVEINGVDMVDALNAVPNTPTFTFKCSLDDREFRATGGSKKLAKRNCAMLACQELFNIQYPD